MKDNWQSDKINMGNGNIFAICQGAMDRAFLSFVKEKYPFINSFKQIRNATVVGKNMNPLIIKFEYRLPIGKELTIKPTT